MRCAPFILVVCSVTRAAVEDDLAPRRRRAQLVEQRWKESKAALAVASRQLLLSEFGPGKDGVRQVEMEVDFGGSKRGKLLIQMAPDTLMPVTVLYFLRLVQDRLLDGAVFHRNAPHVLQGGPGSRRADYDAARLRRGDASLSVPIQEYSPDFPHSLLTMGLAGRPGGPDFYISTQDNTQAHGPGTQSRDALLIGEADPCFAKLVEGLQTVELLKTLPVQPGPYSALVDPVQIMTARILPAAEIRLSSNNSGGPVGDSRGWEL